MPQEARDLAASALFNFKVLSIFHAQELSVIERRDAVHIDEDSPVTVEEPGIIEQLLGFRKLHPAGKRRPAGLAGRCIHINIMMLGSKGPQQTYC